MAEQSYVDHWDEMTQRAGVVAAQLAQTNADLVDLTAELLESGTWAGDGVRSPEHWLMVYCALSPARARDVVQLGRRHRELPETLRDMRAGVVSLDQAAVVARHVPAEYTQSVTNIVPMATVPQLRRVLGKYRYEEPNEVHPAYAERVASLPEEERPLDPVEDGPELSMHTTDGRFHLRFESNSLDGALMEQALREAKDALFTAGDEHATLADALLEVAGRSMSGVPQESRRAHYRVLVHLESDGRGWVNRKGALPQHLVEQLTCDGTVRPVWQRDGAAVSVGRSMRIVPQRTRRLIEDRDGGCRFPGCTATGFLENHHLTHWSKGGTTDMDTLLSLCPRHHREHHQDRFTITGNPAEPTGLVFRDRHGRTIAAVVPDQVPPVQHPPPEETPLRGTRLDSSCVNLLPSGPHEPPDPRARTA